MWTLPFSPSLSPSVSSLAVFHELLVQLSLKLFGSPLPDACQGRACRPRRRLSRYARLPESPTRPQATVHATRRSFPSHSLPSRPLHAPFTPRRAARVPAMAPGLSPAGRLRSRTSDLSDLLRGNQKAHPSDSMIPPVPSIPPSDGLVPAKSRRKLADFLNRKRKTSGVAPETASQKGDDDIDVAVPDAISQR